MAMRGRTTALALALVGVLGATANAADIPTTPAGDPAHGKAVFRGTCVACHGEDGKGVVPGAPDFTDPKGPLAKSDALLLQHMERGYRSPGAMMAMPPKGGNPRLSDQDFRDVLAYLRQAFGKK
ncbi:MAG: c-type cytochrome [Rhodothalassiaceae bacterium]